MQYEPMQVGSDALLSRRLLREDVALPHLCGALLLRGRLLLETVAMCLSAGPVVLRHLLCQTITVVMLASFGSSL